MADKFRVVCDDERFEAARDAAFEGRCTGTFFEQFLNERWNNETDSDGAFIVRGVTADAFRKVWYFLECGVQWPYHKTVSELFEYKEALRYLCIDVPELLTDRVFATPRYLYIPDGGAGICTAIDTEIQVTEIKDTWVVPSPHLRKTSEKISFDSTCHKCVMLDGGSGVLSMSEHGIARELLKHVLFRNKTMICAVITSETPLVLWVQLKCKRRAPMWLLYHDRVPRFMRGRRLHFDTWKRSDHFLFLEVFPDFTLYFSNAFGEDLYRVKLTAPKEADDIIAALMRSYRAGGAGSADENREDRDIEMQQARDKGKGKGAGGYSGLDPLRVRHPKHAGSCLEGRGPKDLWLVQRRDQLVMVVHTFDGRVALCQFRGHGGFIPADWSCARNGKQVTLWGYPGDVSYKRRRMVPRAGSVEGVLPMGEHIYIFHTTTPQQPLRLWTVDALPDGTRSSTFFVSCFNACNPKGKGKGKVFFNHPEGSWLNYWGEEGPQPDLPRGLFKSAGWPPDALVAIDEQCADVEVIRFRRTEKRSRYFAVAHTVASPPAAPRFKQSAQP